MFRASFAAPLKTVFLRGPAAAFLILIAVEVLPSWADSKTGDKGTSDKRNAFILSGFAETGKSSTSEDYEEEDTDDDYTYQNYHLRLEHKISDRLSFDFGSFIYRKDYKSKDSLDNISKLIKTNWSYYLGRQGKDSLRLDLGLRYKEKRYKNTPGYEYDQIGVQSSLVFGKEDVYTVNLTGGFDSYDYLSGSRKNQNRIFGLLKMNRYLMDRKLMLTSSYRVEILEQKIANRRRIKQEVTAGFDYLFKLPWLYKVTVRAQGGQRDTKEDEDEDRDEDLDYKYLNFYAKTEHRIGTKLKTDIKYQYFGKDYMNGELDHSGFYLRNDWDYVLLDDEKRKIGFEFGIEHKDVDYTLKNGNDYTKETIELSAGYRRKKNWKASISFEENFYDFNKSGNNKNRYYVKLSLEKLFFEGDMAVSVDFKYRYTDYEQRNNIAQEAVRLACTYRF